LTAGQNIGLPRTEPPPPPSPNRRHTRIHPASPPAAIDRRARAPPRGASSLRRRGTRPPRLPWRIVLDYSLMNYIHALTIRVREARNERDLPDCLG
jgi:hypothetical protein